MSADVVVAALALGAGVALLAWALFRLAARLRGLEAAGQAPEAALPLLQREIEAVRGEARRDHEATLAAVRGEVVQFAGQVGRELAQVRETVASQLQVVTGEVNHRLREGMTFIQEAQTTMGQRLDQAARAVSDVHGQLGTLTEATRRMEQVGRDISGLEQILRAPKIRGGFGETLLERLLAEILPTDAYRLQHSFRSGDKVDAAIVVAGRLVPVDSKFPLENFRRMIEEPDEIGRAHV